jgi:hypothetical protein
MQTTNTSAPASGACLCAFILALAGLFSSGLAQAANRPPSISGTPATWVYVGSLYSFRPSASDPEGKTLSFSVVNKPGWASFSTSTGRLYGTPSAVGLWTKIRIRVSDGVSTVSLPEFSIRATSPSNVAPTISGAPAATATVGVAYAFQPTAKDANGDPLVFSIANRPAWATFSSKTGRLSGTPTASHVGTYSNITIRVTDGFKTASLPAFTITVKGAGSGNTPPVISGTPATSVVAGNTYAFRPSASDANGDPLNFSIANKPGWAAFSTSTGRLSGTPTSSHVGSYANITIRVSDGKATTSLPAFAITVSDVTNGSATLSWTPPTSNTNGTQLTNLAGYRILYGTSANSLSRSVQIANPGVATYVVSNLSPATWYFAVRSYNTTGVESALSNVASKTIP